MVGALTIKAMPTTSMIFIGEFLLVKKRLGLEVRHVSHYENNCRVFVKDWGCSQKVLNMVNGWSTYHAKQCLQQEDPAWEMNCVYGYYHRPSAPVAQSVRAWFKSWLDLNVFFLPHFAISSYSNVHSH